MSDSQELKHYKTQARKLDERLEQMEEQYKRLGKMIETAVRERQEIEDNISRLKRRNKLIVSEHAILRYLERVEGMDIDAIKDKIVTEEIVNSYEVAGDGKYNLNGFTLVINEKIITTILDK